MPPVPNLILQLKKPLLLAGVVVVKTSPVAIRQPVPAMAFLPVNR